MTRRLDPVRAWTLAAVAAAAAAHLPSLWNGFAYDDHPVVLQNALVRALGNLPALFRTTEWTGAGVELAQYRPLTVATYALNHALAGLSPWSWHATNVALHAAVATLLLRVGLALGLGVGASGAAAVLFAVHPIHVEAVANVIGRKDVLAALFALATVLLHRRALARGGLALALAPLAYAAALFSKESGAVALGLVALSDLAAPVTTGGAPVPPRRRALLYALHLAAFAIWLAAFRAVTAGLGRPPTLDDNPAAHAGAAVRLLTATMVIGKGLLLQAVPVGQSPDWSYPAIPLVGSPADPRLLGAAAALAAWLGLGLWLRRRAPIGLVSLAWYLGALLPVANLLFPIGVLFGERLLYLPSAGLALAAGAALAAAWGRLAAAPAPARRAAAAAALAALLALGVATATYAAAWRDDLTLFRHAARAVPDSSRVHAQLAALLLASDPAAALAEADRATLLNPRNAAAHLSRAAALRALGRADEAGSATRAALDAARGDAGVTLAAPEVERARRAEAEAAAGDAAALYRLGEGARDAGRLDEAAALWRRAVAADPRHAPALADLSGYHLLRGEQDLAVAFGERAVAADARRASAWYNLGLLYRARGDAARSRAAFGRFVETAGPEYAREAAEVRRRLGTAP